MPEEIEQVLNEASGNMELEEYRQLLHDIKFDVQSRLDALDEDETLEI